MGKYIRKAKQPGEVAVMEVTQSNFGVLTRAKTLALQRLLKSSSPQRSTSPATASSGSYLQLRSRRLEKPSIILPFSESRRQKQTRRNPRTKENSRASSRVKLDSVTGEARGSASLHRAKDEERSIEAAKVSVEMVGKGIGSRGVGNDENCHDLGAKESSFGENDFDFDGRERSTRESTPCSLIRDTNTIQTPGSTTRATISSETNQRLRSCRKHIPTAHEMDKFFTGAEEEQQRQFIEKYNFDPVKDKPLPGRYEWEKLSP